MNRLTPRGEPIPPSAAPRRAAKADPPACETCRGRGYIPLCEPPQPEARLRREWGSASGMREALERGDCCLCTCAEGRWWYTWFLELSRPWADREGRPVPTGFCMPSRGIPDFPEISR